MTPADTPTASRYAFRLTQLLDAAFGVTDRFPIDVLSLAQSVGSELRLGARIARVEPANLAGFEGGLFELEPGEWALLYNQTLSSPGRIRFTQAHELGHFLLHRALQGEFHCSQSEVAGYDSDRKKMESDADEFASTLLMPVKQFRASVEGQPISFSLLSEVSERFGVSLTAAALRWIRATDESAVLVCSNNGFMDWSVSSDKARSRGAYFKTRGRVVPVPERALAADPSTPQVREGERRAVSNWFENAHADAVMREMKLECDNYGYTLTLLHLSGGDTVWAPRDWSRD